MLAVLVVFFLVTINVKYSEIFVHDDFFFGKVQGYLYSGHLLIVDHFSATVGVLYTEV